MSSGRELKHPLLCKECDGALSRDGEDWTLPLLATIDGKFPFYDILTRVPPDVDEPDVKGYAASRNPDIDVHKLTHFALGVFWKGSVHSWSGRRNEPQIELGPYGEEIRRFLRSEGGFPRYAALTVGITPPPVKDIAFCQPYLGSKSNCHFFMFYAPGIALALSVGKRIGDAKANCFYSNPLHPIVVGDIASGIKTVFRKVSAGAHKSRKLVKYLQERSGSR